MTPTDVIGTIGVVLMLTAFFLNISDKMHNDHPIYIVLNLVGSSLACYASLVIEYYPFVFLEGIWMSFSTWALCIFFKRDFKKFFGKK
jgi:hypothetical protein